MQNTICGASQCKVPQIGFCIFILQSTIWCTLHCKVCQIVFCIYSTLKLKFIILFASQPMLQYFPYCPWLQDCVPTLAFSSTSFILWIDLCTEYKSTNIFGRRFSYSFHVLAEARPIVPHHSLFIQILDKQLFRGQIEEFPTKLRESVESAAINRHSICTDLNWLTKRPPGVYTDVPQTLGEKTTCFLSSLLYGLSMAWPVLSCGAFSWV